MKKFTIRAGEQRGRQIFGWNSRLSCIIPRMVLITTSLLIAGTCFAQTQVPIPSTGVYAENPHSRMVLVGSNAMIFGGSANNAYYPMPNVNTMVPLDGKKGTLVTVTFSAESQCADGGTDPGWCGVRILVDGIEAEPSPADFAFDSTNNGEEGIASWEGHSMQRHICFVDYKKGDLLPVDVQWRVFSSDGDISAPAFRIDDWSLTVETASATCQ